MGTFCEILKIMLTPGDPLTGDGAKVVVGILWFISLCFIGGIWVGNTHLEFFGYNTVASVFLFLVAYAGTCVISRSWK